MTDEILKKQLDSIREYSLKMQRVVAMYARLEAIARNPGSKLAPILEMAGERVSNDFERTGALLECLMDL